VGQQYEINPGDIERELLPVKLTQFFDALEHAAIHQYGFTRKLYQVFGAGYGSGRSEEVYVC
jgi:hypothetical protein